MVGRHPEPNIYHIKPVSGNGPVWIPNQHQLQDLGKTKNDRGLTSSQYNHDGSQIPSFNPSKKLIKSPPNTHHYAIPLKGRSPMPSLSTTTGVGSSGLRPDNLRESSSVLGALANPIGFRTMAESAGSRVAHFYFLIFLWAIFETGIIISPLSFSLLSPCLLQVDPCGEGGP